MSSFNLSAHNDGLFCIPLGGTNEVGMNLTLYRYKGKYIIVDCGSGFADEALPGANVVVADISFIVEHKKDLLGMVITHAHEDHLGAIPFLWSQLECPIYTSDFTANFLMIKMTDFKLAQDIPITALKPGSRFTLGPFDIEFSPLSHSAPEMQALMIRTGAGNILHTGDWKFDPDPVVGVAPDESVLKAYGDEGVLALVCDSTNVMSAGHSGSEGDLRESLVKIITNCQKMVVISTFASNLARLSTLIHAAQQTKRKVVLAGRSLHRMLQAAQSSGYLQDATFITEKEIPNYPREQILIIATGCQGEPLAAVNKMASKAHPYVQLAAGDTIVFSSKIIPGNEKRIFRLFNMLIKQKVEVITEKDHFVHVSGHPCIEELRKMYELTRPNVAIPVHGEPLHIHEHAKLAKSFGVKSVVEVFNGGIVNICKDESSVVGVVKNGYLAVDGNSLLPDNADVFKDRKHLREAGVAVVTLLFQKNHELICPPILNLPGVLSINQDKEHIKRLKKEIHNVIRQEKATQQLHAEKVRKAVFSFLKRTFLKRLDKKPMLIVNVEYPK